MGIKLGIRDKVIHRHQTADHAVGNAMRRQFRDQLDGERHKDGNSPFNEAFSFTQEEYDILKKLKPHLFDQTLDPQTRLKHWKAFANSSEGRVFRVK
jgi:hypothetical protein